MSAHVTPVRRSAWRVAAIAGAAAVLLFALAAVADPAGAFQSYLFVWWFLLGIPLGSLAILMVHNLTGGRWGETIRPALDAAARLLPLSLLFTLPLLAGLHDVYAWSQPGAADDPLLRDKAWYLNVEFFVIRNAVYFAVWLVLGRSLRKWAFARHSDATVDEKERLRAVSAVGLLVYAVTVTFAAIDWIMSLMPQWYSTAFGLLAAMGQVLGAFSFTIIWTAWSAHTADAQRIPGASAAPHDDITSRFHDLGNLLLTLVMTWAYLAFTQYLIIWAEDLPNEIAWYLPRVETSWRVVALCLVVFHFAVPLVVLLSRRAKRAPRVLATLAALLLFAHLIDAWWLVVPAFRVEGVTLNWTDPLAVLGLGGLWLAALLRRGAALRDARNGARGSVPLPDHG
jgi:hypothetical protein